MKKITKVLLLSLSSILLLSACGNYTLFDTTYTFSYAIIELPNGEIVEGNVLKWTDYEGEQLQITLDDGNTYLVSSYNSVLMENVPNK